MNNETPIQPTVGMGATIGYGSDRYPMTVIRIIAWNKIEAISDISRVVSGSCTDGSAVWEITQAPVNEATKGAIFRLRKNGKWIRDGQSMKYGERLCLGHRDRHEDPSF